MCERSRARTKGRDFEMKRGLGRCRNAKSEEVLFCMGCYAPNQIRSNGIGRKHQCECDGDMCIVRSDYGIRTGFRIFDQLTSEGNRRETAACWKSGGTLNPIEGVGSARIRWIWLRPDCLNHRCLAQNTRGHTRKVYRIMCVGRSLECLLICHPKVLHPSRRPIRAMKHRKWGLSPSLYAYL